MQRKCLFKSNITLLFKQLNLHLRQYYFKNSYILKTDNLFFFLYFTAPSAMLINEHYSEIQLRFYVHDHS